MNRSMKHSQKASRPRTSAVGTASRGLQRVLGPVLRETAGGAKGRHRLEGCLWSF